jgi:16S rRNA (guanine527-N7)-methyltransferase
MPTSLPVMSGEAAPWEERLARWGLEETQLSQFGVLLQVLERDPHAPTAVRDISQAADVHLADSLSALELGVVRDADSIADLGAGAGFPGLAIAIAVPSAEVRLIESQRRKCEFLERARSAAGIDNARVVCARAEQWCGGLSGNDVVMARALAAQPVVLEYAAPLLPVGGTLVDWRGRRVPAEELESLVAAEILGLRLVEIRSVRPFARATDRHLHQWVKLEETPERFPRRAGIARKRPLGASDRERR